VVIIFEDALTGPTRTMHLFIFISIIEHLASVDQCPLERVSSSAALGDIFVQVVDRKDNVSSLSSVL